MHITDRFFNKKWGVMTHLLPYNQNNPEHFSNMGQGKKNWNDLIKNIDVKLIAKQLNKIGAGYYLLTMQQGDKYMNSPNSSYDKITGYKSGEACVERDLIMDLSQALTVYDIDLFLYFTGDGPWQDEQAGKAMGFTDRTKPVSEQFVKNWAEVLKEYSMRYKNNVKGWWIDGCYDYFGFNENLIKYYSDAITAGNPDALKTFNNGDLVRDYVDLHIKDIKQRRYSIYENYTSGEAIEFNVYPECRFVDGSQWHIFSTLSGKGWQGCGWGNYGSKYSPEFIKNYITKVNMSGGVVTVDMALKIDSIFDDEQIKAVSLLKQNK